MNPLVWASVLQGPSLFIQLPQCRAPQLVFAVDCCLSSRGLSSLLLKAPQNRDLSGNFSQYCALIFLFIFFFLKKGNYVFHD